MKNLYTLSSIDKLISECMEAGYTMETCYEGTLGYGKVVLVAPDERHWNFVITEVPLNCWSSAHSVRKCRTISKALWTEIERYYAEMES